MTESMPNNSIKNNNIPWKWLLLISFCALLIRLIAAYIQPPFLDEGFVFFTTKAGIAQLIHELKIDAHPPTFNLLIYPLVKLTHSIFILRLPQVLLALPALWLVYFITRRFTSEKLALTAAGIYALDRSVWLTDAQLRSYGPLSFCLLAVWLGMLDLRKNGSPLSSLMPRRPQLGWFVFALAAVLAASLHVIGCLAIGVAILFCFCLNSHVRRTALTTLLISVVPCGGWFLWSRLTPHFSGRATAAHASWDCIAASPLSILGCWDVSAFYNLIADISWLQFTIKYVFFLYLAANIIVCLIYICGWRSFAKDRPCEAHFLSLSVLLPFILLIIGDKLSLLSFQPRYLYPFTLPFLLLLLKADNIASRCLTAIVITVSLLNCLLFPSCPVMWNQNWQPTLEFIQSTQHPEDVIAVTDPYSVYGFAYAYDADNINFVFQNTNSSNVAIAQNPVPGKLRVIPIDTYMLNPQLINWLGNGQLYLVICQSPNTLSALLAELEQYYTVIDYKKTPSMTSWAVTLVLRLERKTPQNNNVS